MKTESFREIYTTNEGRLRIPLIGFGSALRTEGSKVSIAETRAIQNVGSFIFSLGIMSRRLKDYIENYRESKWADVPFYELFLDTQSFFLFVQQFLEDLTFILRMSLPHKQRHQMPANFSDFIPRLRRSVLASDAPLQVFFVSEQSWFDQIQALRDDILHRTAYGRERAATFPELSDVIAAGGGKQEFIRGADLRSYVGGIIIRLFVLACLAEDFVRETFIFQNPDALTSLHSASLLAADEYDSDAPSPAGTGIVTIGRECYDALKFFF